MNEETHFTDRPEKITINKNTPTCHTTLARTKKPLRNKSNQSGILPGNTLEETKMASNRKNSNLNNIKMQAANEVGVPLKDNGYNGDLTSKQAGSVGGQMVKKMIESYQNSAK